MIKKTQNKGSILLKVTEPVSQRVLDCQPLTPNRQSSSAAAQSIPGYLPGKGSPLPPTGLSLVLRFLPHWPPLGS